LPGSKKQPKENKRIKKLAGMSLEKTMQLEKKHA
jgi:hypothetical protein